MKNTILIFVVIFLVILNLGSHVQLWYDIAYGETIYKPYQPVVYGVYTNRFFPIHYKWSQEATTNEWKTICEKHPLRVRDPFNIMEESYSLDVKCTIESSYVTSQL